MSAILERILVCLLWVAGMICILLTALVVGVVTYSDLGYRQHDRN